MELKNQIMSIPESKKWPVSEQFGVGQELVTVGQKTLARVSAEGTLPVEKLVELGINLEDIESYLKNKLAELGDQTRLSVECRPEPEKDWQYLYEILTQDESIGVTVAVESVSYQGERVYLCPIILSQVK